MHDRPLTKDPETEQLITVPNHQLAEMIARILHNRTGYDFEIKTNSIFSEVRVFSGLEEERFAYLQGYATALFDQYGRLFSYD